MYERGAVRSANGVIEFAFTDRSCGDFSIRSEPGGLSVRRSDVCPAEWTWLDQVHGDNVVVVSRPGDHCGERADGAVTDVVGAALAVQTADCAPLLFGWPGDDERASVVGAAHAGWQGLYDGVVETTVDAMEQLGAVRSQIWWKLGPCISPSAYEFSASDLTRLALRFGPDVVSSTADGAPAFDLPVAVRSVLRSCGLVSPAPGAPVTEPPCTATAVDNDGEPMYFSWRARRDAGRQTSVIWIAP